MPDAGLLITPRMISANELVYGYDAQSGAFLRHREDGPAYIRDAGRETFDVLLPTRAEYNHKGKIVHAEYKLANPNPARSGEYWLHSVENTDALNGLEVRVDFYVKNEGKGMISRPASEQAGTVIPDDVRVLIPERTPNRLGAGRFVVEDLIQELVEMCEYPPVSS